MNKEKSVSKNEFFDFLRSYPRELVRDVFGASEPPLITYNDFSLGVWPDSVVAWTFLWDDNEDGYNYKPEGERKYYISIIEKR